MNTKDNAQLVLLMTENLKNDVDEYIRAVRLAKSEGQKVVYVDNKSHTKSAIQNKIKTLKYTLMELSKSV